VAPHGDPDYIRNQALASIDRLGVDSIDLYQFHRPDPETPFEDSVHAFAELQDEGLVDHVGLSNVSVDQLETARDIVDVATVQNSLQRRRPRTRGRALGLRGVRHRLHPLLPDGRRRPRRKSRTPWRRSPQTTTPPSGRWRSRLLDHSDVTLLIPGTSSVDHLEANVAASHLELTDEDRARLE